MSHSYDRRRGIPTPDLSSRLSSSTTSARSSRLYQRYDINTLGSGTSVQEARRLRRNRRLIIYLVVLLISIAAWTAFQSDDEGNGVKAGSSFVHVEQQNDEQRTNYNDKILVSSSVKQKQKLTREQQIEQQQIMDDLRLDKRQKKRWNPCSNTKYELERHDFETQHGDICRIKGGVLGIYECPDGCYETAGNAPYCANDNGGEKGKTMGSKGGPCRVRNPDAPPEFRCDDAGVCIMAVGTGVTNSQFKGEGVYYDDSCDNQCGNGREGELSFWVANGRRCNSDWDCSLAGTCTSQGQCQCDPWAEGVDCSYLKFQPVDRLKLGYLDEQNTSWGGSIVQSANTGLYHMYVSEILCKIDLNVRKRCGLNAWQTHSRIVEAISAEIEGPYNLVKQVLPPEHHNPSVHVSPITGHWHLFSISGPTGPIVRLVSRDEGKTWGYPLTISPEQNPGPILMSDGTTRLFFRADGMAIKPPTCSDEGILMQVCPSETEPCNPSTGNPILPHTGEDPSVFVDHRGNYHMLFNALPYKCVPKLQQGGHAWSKDGIEWSTPRVGAFNTTIQFTDGSNMTCERRERPQMVLGKDGMPLALISAVTGCPDALGLEESSLKRNPYKGGDDAFTLIQKMGR